MPSDAQRKANQAAGLPDWYEPEAPPAPTAPAAHQSDARPLPDWYTPETEGATPAATKPETLGKQLGDVAANVGTGLLRVPGAIIGTPHLVGHTLNWAKAQYFNGLDKIFGGPGGHTGAEMDKQDLVMRALPSAEGVDKFVENPPHPKAMDFLFNSINDPSKPAQFYQPQSFGGRLLQAGVTGAASGGTGIVNKAKMALAADAATTSNEVFPDNPALAALAAIAAHGGASGVEAAARAGSGVTADAVRQVFRPAEQGRVEAGRVLRNADNAGAPLASPTDAELARGTNSVKTTTDDFGPGQQPWQAGAELRAGLQARADALKAQRGAAADKAYETFREQAPLPAHELAPFMSSPSFRKAVGDANGAMLDEGRDTLTHYWDFDQAGDPILRPNAAIPPEVLHRVKSYLGSASGKAPPGSPEARTAGILDKRFAAFLEKQYPAKGDFAGYGAIRQSYADASRPLDVFEHGPVGKTLEAEKNFGQSRYTLADERVPDLFLRSKATRADLNQLITASGGDRKAALSALQDHLAGVAQSAVRPDGTLDAAAFARAMKPYQQSLGNLGIWFPELSQKFNSAKQAQSSLETLQAQRGLADAVRGGALRDGDGAITAASFGKWLQGNSDAIRKTQTPAAAMRLQSFASALQNARPGELADTLKAELLPAAIGMATGGTEGGVFGVLLHKTGKTMFGGLDQKRQAAFSAAMEQAVLDPAYAARLAQAASKQGNGVRPVRALVRAVAATPLALNAAGAR